MPDDNGQNVNEFAALINNSRSHVPSRNIALHLNRHFLNTNGIGHWWNYNEPLRVIQIYIVLDFMSITAVHVPFRNYRIQGVPMRSCLADGPTS